MTKLDNIFRFTAFLNRYKPRAAPLLVKYLDALKACKAVEYANALAESFPVAHETGSPHQKAASIEPWFESSLNRAFDSLVNETLPAYVTNCLTRVVTEIMVREITGQGMPLMRELVGGLAEVFCLADPSIQDCPIIYASEEFYHTTRYARVRLAPTSATRTRNVDFQSIKGDQSSLFQIIPFSPDTPQSRDSPLRLNFHSILHFSTSNYKHTAKTTEKTTNGI